LGADFEGYRGSIHEFDLGQLTGAKGVQAFFT